MLGIGLKYTFALLGHPSGCHSDIDLVCCRIELGIIPQTWSTTDQRAPTSEAVQIKRNSIRLYEVIAMCLATEKFHQYSGGK